MYLSSSATRTMRQSSRGRSSWSLPLSRTNTELRRKSCSSNPAIVLRELSQELDLALEYPQRQLYSLLSSDGSATRPDRVNEAGAQIVEALELRAQMKPLVVIGAQRVCDRLA